MKLKAIVSGLLIVAALCAFQGCKKEQVTPQPMEIQGVKVELYKLDQAFTNAPLEIAEVKNDAIQNIRYGLHEKAFMALDKLASNPGLTDQQKKAVNEIIDQMKQVVAKSPPAPAH